MIDGLKPYSEYKDSGVPWLGKVPAHWNLLRLKRLLRVVDDRSTTGEETLLSLRREHGVVVYSEHFSRPAQGDTTIGYKRVKRGQIVLNRLQANNGLIFDSRYDGLVSPDYSVFATTRPIDVVLLGTILRTPEYKTHFRRESTGLGTGSAGFLRLYDDRFLTTMVAVPGLEEQAAMMRFVRGFDRRLRQVVRAKQRLIALLEEQKQGIVDRAVTNGLREEPVESFNAWQSDVPAGWRVIRLKHTITRIEQGWSPQCFSERSQNGEWGVLKVGCVNGDRFDENQNKKLPPDLDPPEELEIREGDILVSRANTRALIGLAALAVQPRPRLLLCDKLFRFRARAGVADPFFLVLAIRQRQSRAQIESSTNGASDSMQNIGQGVIANLTLALPPLEEQAEIVSAIRQRTSSLSAMVARTTREVELLRHCRARLVSDVVIGRVDVRDAAARFTEERDETESFDDAEVESAPEDEEVDATAEEVEV